MSSSERYKLTVAELEALPAGHVLKLASDGELWAKARTSAPYFYRVEGDVIRVIGGAGERSARFIARLWLAPHDQPSQPPKTMSTITRERRELSEAALSATAGLSTAYLTALADAGGVKRVLELLAKYHWYHVDCEEYMENHDPPIWVRDTGNILRAMTELADTALLGKENTDGQD